MVDYKCGAGEKKFWITYLIVGIVSVLMVLVIQSGIAQDGSGLRNAGITSSGFVAGGLMSAGSFQIWKSSKMVNSQLRKAKEAENEKLIAKHEERCDNALNIVIGFLYIVAGGCFVALTFLMGNLVWLQGISIGLFALTSGLTIFWMCTTNFGEKENGGGWVSSAANVLVNPTRRFKRVKSELDALEKELESAKEKVDDQKGAKKENIEQCAKILGDFRRVSNGNPQNTNRDGEEKKEQDKKSMTALDSTQYQMDDDNVIAEQKISDALSIHSAEKIAGISVGNDDDSDFPDIADDLSDFTDVFPAGDGFYDKNKQEIILLESAISDLPEVPSIAEATNRDTSIETVSPSDEF